MADRDVHLETFGMYRDFYDRVAYTTIISGFGARTTNRRHDRLRRRCAASIVRRHPTTARLPGVRHLVGRGIGRYGTSQLSDVIVAGDGSLKAVPEGMLLGGLTAHVTPSLDVYGFAGIEKELRTYGENSDGTYYGLGRPTANTASVASCNQEPNVGGSTTLCNTGNGNNKQIFQLTAGFWDKIYKGSFGEVRVGAQYQYNGREVFNNIPGVVVNGVPVFTNNYQPKAFDQAVLTSLRYYPFQ